MNYNTYNIADPETLTVNGENYLDLPYDEKIYVKKGDYYITKVSHAEDIGIHRYIVTFKEDYKDDLELTYNPSIFRWVSMNWDLI